LSISANAFFSHKVAASRRQTILNLADRFLFIGARPGEGTPSSDGQLRCQNRAHFDLPLPKAQPIHAN